MEKFDFNDKKKIFFSGIGGISMNGLAKLLLSKGFSLAGSDTARTDFTVELERMGVKIFYSQSKTNITDDIDMVVHSKAIKRTNEELKKAEELGIDIYTRGQFLGMIMNNYNTSICISGTHGKTTTTTMVGDIFLKANKNPTISVGGIMPSTGTNFYIAGDDFFITEACEYTNTFFNFYPNTAIILNCELDHTDFFKDEEDFRSSFKRFAGNVREGGNLIVNASISNYEYFKNDKANFITFAVDKKADYEARNLEVVNYEYVKFDLYIRGVFKTIINLNGIGKYNVENALGAIAAGIENGLEIETIKQALRNFNAAERRFQIMGELNGIKVISDFAHHPTALRYAISTARQICKGRLWVCFQPHAYSRTKEFLNEFAKELSDADVVILTPIYAARETNIYNVYSNDIADLIDKKTTEVYVVENFGEAEDIILTGTNSGDIVMAVGGGNIDCLAKDLMGISYEK